jgi:WD40 repeat protein
MNKINAMAILVWLVGCFSVGLIQGQSLVQYGNRSIMSISNDGTTIAISGTVTDVSASTGVKYVIDLYDRISANQIGSINVGEHNIEGLSLSKTGQYLAFSTGIGRLVIVDTQNQTIERVIVEGGFAEVGYPRFSNENDLFAYFFGNTAIVVDLSVQNAEAVNLSDSSYANIIGVDWHPNGDQLAALELDTDSASVSVLVWDLQNTSQSNLLGRYVVPPSNSVRWSPDGDSFATNQVGGVVITELSTGNQQTLQATDTQSVIQSFAWHPEGNRIAGGGDGAIYIWDIQTGVVIDKIIAQNIVWNVIWSPSGDFLYHTDDNQGIYRNGIPLQEAVSQTPTLNDNTP